MDSLSIEAPRPPLCLPALEVASLQDQLQPLQLPDDIVQTALASFKSVSDDLCQEAENTYAKVSSNLRCLPTTGDPPLPTQPTEYLVEAREALLARHHAALRRAIQCIIQGCARWKGAEKFEGDSEEVSESPQDILEEAWSRGTKITIGEKNRLAQATGLSPRQVSVWFANQRQRRRSGDSYPSPDSSPSKKRKRSSDAPETSPSGKRSRQQKGRSPSSSSAESDEALPESPETTTDSSPLAYGVDFTTHRSASPELSPTSMQFLFDLETSASVSASIESPSPSGPAAGLPFQTSESPSIPFRLFSSEFLSGDPFLASTPSMSSGRSTPSVRSCSSSSSLSSCVGTPSSSSLDLAGPVDVVPYSEPHTLFDFDSTMGSKETFSSLQPSQNPPCTSSFTFLPPADADAASDFLALSDGVEDSFWTQIMESAGLSEPVVHIDPGVVDGGAFGDLNLGTGTGTAGFESDFGLSLQLV